MITDTVKEIAIRYPLAETISCLADQYSREDILDAVKFVMDNQRITNLAADYLRLGYGYWKNSPDDLNEILSSGLIPDVRPEMFLPPMHSGPISEPEIKQIYLMHNNRNNLYKIGISNNPRFREETLQGEEPEVELVAHWPGSIQDERVLHEEFAHRRVRGEWFKLSPEEVTNILTRNIPTTP